MRLHPYFKTSLAISVAATFATSVLHAQNRETNEESARSEVRQKQAQASSVQDSQSRSSKQQSATAAQSEASQEELKVKQSEAQKEVTDINKASNIIGMKVVNKQNEDIGTIKDLVVDFQSGKIAYAVLASGSVLGMGGKLIAIPAESLTPKRGDEALLLNADENRLSQAAGFNENDWPRMDAAQDSSVGLTPTGRTSEQSGRSEYGPSESSRTQERQETSQSREKQEER